jgi:hypothetical protein
LRLQLVRCLRHFFSQQFISEFSNAVALKRAQSYTSNGECSTWLWVAAEAATLTAILQSSLQALWHG